VNGEKNGKESDKVNYLNDIDLDFDWLSLFDLDQTAQVK
jgi:hypothetical protein